MTKPPLAALSHDIRPDPAGGCESTHGSTIEWWPNTLAFCVITQGILFFLHADAAWRRWRSVPASEIGVTAPCAKPDNPYVSIMSTQPFYPLARPYLSWVLTTSFQKKKNKYATTSIYMYHFQLINITTCKYSSIEGYMYVKDRMLYISRKGSTCV